MENIEIIIVNIMNMIMMIGITIAFVLSCYWNTRYLMIEKRKSFCWIKVHLAIASALMVCIYIYLFVMLILQRPVTISIFSNIIIRPVVLYLGCTIAAGARLRYLTAKNGA